jgi:hypothetical protein
MRVGGVLCYVVQFVITVYVCACVVCECARVVVVGGGGGGLTWQFPTAIPVGIAC